MDQVTDLAKNLINQTETILNRGLDNIYITTAIKVFLGLYAGFAAPKLPPSILLLLDNMLFRVVLAFTIVLVATRDPSIALMISVAFIITLQTANRYRLIDTSLSVADKGQVSWLPSAKNGTNESFNAMGSSSSGPGTGVKVEPRGMIGNEESSENSPEQFLPFHSNVENFDIDHMKGSKPIENFHSEPPAFTTSSQFRSAQDNTVPGSDQNTCVTTFRNQHCTQGLSDNSPNGAN